MHRFLAATTFCVAALLATGAGAFPFDRPSAEEGEAYMVAQQADCSAAAQQAASESGGQVLSVSSRGSGADTECVVTVLVPGQDGDRPRKQTITVRP